MNYRRDSRTVEKFAQDIKECSSIERNLMERYTHWLNTEWLKTKEGDGGYIIVDHGVDNSGELITDDRKVDARADFILRKEGKPDQKIEIKFCREERNAFHLKVHQIEKYVKEDVCLINWMGINGPNARFCVMSPTDLKYWLINGERKRFWHKDCLRLKCKDFGWIIA